MIVYLIGYLGLDSPCSALSEFIIDVHITSVAAKGKSRCCKQQAWSANPTRFSQSCSSSMDVVIILVPRRHDWELRCGGNIQRTFVLFQETSEGVLNKYLYPHLWARAWALVLLPPSLHTTGRGLSVGRYSVVLQRRGSATSKHHNIESGFEAEVYALCSTLNCQGKQPTLHILRFSR